MEAELVPPATLIAVRRQRQWRARQLLPFDGGRVLVMAAILVWRNEADELNKSPSAFGQHGMHGFAARVCVGF